MISYPDRSDVIQRVYDHGQEHVFTFWEQLPDVKKKALLDDVASIDFDLLSRLYLQARESKPTAMGFEPAPYIPAPSGNKDLRRFDAAREEGIALIRKGVVAAFVVAGGQGSRLGFGGPKGLFGVGPVSGKSLFQIHAEKILKSSIKYGAPIPWLIMTSQANHEDTVRYLTANRHFGLDEKDVYIFPQSMIPSLDTGGKLILESPSAIFKNPDGHGGSLDALADSGTLAAMRKRGIGIISYFQVDNPLISIIDPVFIGFHAQRGADISSKGLMKAYPGEKIGVFVRFDDGTIGVVEYSDLPERLQNMRDGSGALRFCMGSIAIHLFCVGFLEKITGGSAVSLPFHVARKKITPCTPSGPAEIEGFKFEKFVFDALPLTDKNIVLETIREDEFAPIKNPSGVDSVESAHELMTGLYRRWLGERGILIPSLVKKLEISPLLALEAADIPDSLSIPDAESVYLE
ncbi:MAG TPA: UDPGP type 1 family protein [Spirochaetota bacterium]|nr:UDPGP type 1 family protein [Spirochaetota bacterium]